MINMSEILIFFSGLAIGVAAVSFYFFTKKGNTPIDLKKLETDLIKWNIKSTTKAHQGLYEYDAVTRLRDSQLGEKGVKDVNNYIKKGVLWYAFTATKKPVLLIAVSYTHLTLPTIYSV